MSRVIVIASGKGGVGKTTIAANLGICLGQAERKTALVDLDLGLRNVDVTLGLETVVLNHLGDFFEERMPLEEVVTTDERYPGLALLAAPQNMDPADLKEEQLERLVQELRAAYDVILIDAPAGVGPVFSAAVKLADEGVVVTTPTVSAVRDADKVLHLMEAAGIPYRFVIVNMLRRQLMKEGIMMSPDDIRDVLGTPLLGVIPDDETALVGCNTGRPLVTVKCMSGSALRRIAERVRGTALSLPPLTARRRGLFHA